MNVYSLKWLKERLKNALRSLFFEIWAFRGPIHSANCFAVSGNRLVIIVTFSKSVILLHFRNSTFCYAENRPYCGASEKTTSFKNLAPIKNTRCQYLKKKLEFDPMIKMHKKQVNK